MTGRNEFCYSIIGKIILYSKEENVEKFHKYLKQALTQCSSNVSSNNGKEKFEITLRRKGALRSILIFVTKLINSCAVISKEEKDLNKFFSEKGHKDLFNSSLALLGNSFALDHSSRKEACAVRFLQTLEKFIQTVNVLKSLAFPEIIKGAIKCVANLCNASAECLKLIIKSKMETPNALLDTIDNIYMKITPNNLDNSSNLEQEKIIVTKIDKENYDLLRSTVRAIRIISSSSDVSLYRTCFQERCIRTVGHILTWKFYLQDDLKLDIIRTLTFLSEKPKLVPSELFTQSLVSNSEDNVLGQLVKIFQESHKTCSKLQTATIRCLQSFSKNGRIASKLGTDGLLDAILTVLESTEDKGVLGQYLRLLSTLTKAPENKYQLSKSLNFGSTLKFLRNEKLKEYHPMILSIYEDLYEQSFVTLQSAGLFGILKDILLDEAGKIDVSSLSQRISSLDTDKCNAHREIGCPFEPKFRCSSPSYQQVQKVVKSYLKARESQFEDREGQMSTSFVNKQLDPCSWTYLASPPQSPSWSSSSGCSSPTSDSGTNFYENASGSEGKHSPVYYAFSDVDEGNESLSPADYSENPDEIEMQNLSPLSGNSLETSLEEPLAKRRKIEKMLTINDNVNNMNENEIDVKKKSVEERKASAKKIVSILTILHKCTLLKTLPLDIVEMTPALLSVILSAKVSISLLKSGQVSQGHWDSECQSLGRRSFELSFKILRAMFLKITTFPQLVVGGTIPLLSKMISLPRYIDESSTPLFKVECDFHTYCESLMKSLTGVENETAGWREGFLIRQLLINKCESEVNTIALHIPLLYKVDNQSFKNFQQQGKCWDIVFDVLTKSSTEEISFPELQCCVLALSSLCDTLGMTWSARDCRSNEPTLKIRRNPFTDDEDEFSSTNQFFSEENEETNNANCVLFELDDGSKISAKKDVLTNASPVFGAMFNGYFLESGEQRVQLPNTSKAALFALFEQIKYLEEENNSNITDDEIKPKTEEEHTVKDDFYELETIFKILSLSDQYLLETIHRRALNTLLKFYMCPNSAPMIYSEAVKMSSLWKPEERHRAAGGHMDLTFLVLKYLLVGKNIGVTSKCGAFWKIFDSVSHLTVVSDLRAMIDFHVFNKNLNR